MGTPIKCCIVLIVLNFVQTASFIKEDTLFHYLFHCCPTGMISILTLVLLNPDIPWLCKQCRSRSVGFFWTQLIWICTVCHYLCEFIEQSGSFIWLAENKKWVWHLNLFSRARLTKLHPWISTVKFCSICFSMINIPKFQTLYSILFWSKVCFICTVP